MTRRRLLPAILALAILLLGGCTPDRPVPGGPTTPSGEAHPSGQEVPAASPPAEADDPYGY